MKIISNFRDYYDVCQKYGQDKRVVYTRNTQDSHEVKLPFNIKQYSFIGEIFTNVPVLRSWDIRNEKFSNEHNLTVGFSNGLVGFCGKWYPHIRMDITQINNINLTISSNFFVYSYSLDEFLFNLERYKFNDFKEFIYRTKTRYKHKKDNDFNVVNLEKYFKKYSGIADKSNIFSEQKCPIVFVKGVWRSVFQSDADNMKVIMNPNLHKLNFMKVIDPYTAFQELEIFMSGVLGVGEPQIVTISDKDKIEKRGFNKWSFRKQSVPFKEK